MFPGDRSSVFDPRRRNDDEADQWVMCPVHRCRYEVPVDLEDVARERHRSAHSTQEWAGVSEMLQRRKNEAREDYLKVSALVDADLRRLQLWTEQGA